MKNYTFNFEVLTLTTQFANAFNDVVIKRYNNERVANGQEIGVNFIYAPKQRVIHDLTNKQNELRLPIVSYNITNFSRDPSRVFNKLEGPEILNSRKYEKILQPVPVNLGISLNIFAKFQLDMDQIISNFVPYCDPYVVVSWPDPYAEQEIRTIIEWDGSVSINYPMDQSAATPFSRIEGSANFTIKGWLFKAQTGSMGIIHNIYNNFFAVNDIYCSYTAMRSVTSELATDYQVVSGRPVLNGATPTTLYNETSGQLVTVTGSMFNKTTAYFISGPESIIGQSTVYDFTTSRYISAYIDSIEGIQITPNILNDYTLTCTISTGAGGGYFDIIAINDAGIGRLSVDSIRHVPCPYTTEEECAIWEPYQPPTISGIYVM